MKQISKPVWILSIVSLMTDMASEMLYPVMPVYLKSIGFTVITIGVLEGFVEAIAGLSKGYFGKLSDIKGVRVPFIQWGYGLSAVSKPLLALFTYPAWVFGARTIDRIGKGLRTGARDALLSDESTPQTKGKVFGFHRSMDTIGAVIGPLFALLFLYFNPQQYKQLFIIAFIPGILAVVATFYLKEKKRKQQVETKKIAFFSFLNYWKDSSKEYKKLVTGLLIFALFNSSDIFLLLKAKEANINDTVVIGLYIFYNLVYAISAFPLGILADKIGLKKIFLIGLFLFAIVYLGMAMSTHKYSIIALFFIYGLYAAATEGVSKAWISNIVSKGETATAIGTYTGLQSIAALLASSFTGLVWYIFDGEAALITSAIATIFVIFYFLSQNINQAQNKLAA